MISTLGGSPSFAMFGGTAASVRIRASASAQTTDAVYLPACLAGGRWTGDINLTDSLRCPWCLQPQLGSLLVVQPLGQLRRGSLRRRRDRHPCCQGSVLRELQLRQGSESQTISCNPDFNIAQVGVVTRWTPVKNLTFSAEVGAFFLDQKFTGAASLDAGGSEADRSSTSSRTRALCS